MLDSGELEEAYKALDSSGDGKIDRKEFMDWFESAEASSHSGGKLAGLKAKLYGSQALSFFRGMKAAGAVQAKDWTIQCGEMDKVAASVVINVITDGKGADAFGMEGSVTFLHKGGKDFQDFSDVIVGHLKEAALIGLRSQEYGRDMEPEITFTHSDAKSMTFSATCTAKKRKPQNMTRDLDQFKEMFGPMKITFELGWSVASIVEKKDFALADLFVGRINFQGNLPEPIQQSLGLIPMVLGGSGFQAEDIPGLNDVMENKDKAVVDLSAFVEMVMTKMPGDFQGKSLRELVTFGYEQSNMPSYKRDQFQMGLNAIRVFLLMLKRDLVSPAGVSCLLGGRVGGSVDLNIFSFDDLYDLVGVVQECTKPAEISNE